MNWRERVFPLYIGSVVSIFSGKMVLALMVASLGMLGNLYATTLTVTNAADSGVGTLRQALADANDGDTLDFDAEVTYITLTSGRLGINDSIHIKGPGSADLTIDGNANDRIFYMIKAGTTSIVSGITVKNGAIEGSTTIGGGIFLGTNDTLSLTISNCVISGCTAGYGGGGIGLSGGKVEIVDTTITGCSATNSGGDGGAIFNETGLGLYLKNCSISGNTADDEGGAVYSKSKMIAENCTITSNSVQDTGGGVSFKSVNTSTSLIVNCTISNNASTNDGGGIRIYDSNVDISNCLIAANSAGDDGGGAYVDAASHERTTHIWSSTFSDNTAQVKGGALLVDDQKVWIHYPTFSGNASVGGTTDSDGGAIQQVTGRSYLSIDSSLFYNNHATDDGGALVLRDPAELRNCTISGNIADDQGGGLYLHGGSTETQKIYNCTIYSNTCATATKGGGIYLSTSDLELFSSIIVSNVVGEDIHGTPAIMNYCLYGTRSATPDSETNNIIGNARLASLADNGGPTLTHALMKGSAAIDAGSNPLALAYDQRGGGYAREFPAGYPDIGAFEYRSGEPLGALMIIH